MAYIFKKLLAILAVAQIVFAQNDVKGPRLKLTYRRAGTDSVINFFELA
ncbi:hypothetical protein IMCC9480_2516 [Oxalobacteraceae bacterium IMCC9480]|nr:hypothetical protein IMCC9480_2516 [Oxalobacteraceae bacterium IMCC9480]